MERDTVGHLSFPKMALLNSVKNISCIILMVIWNLLPFVWQTNVLPHNHQDRTSGQDL